MKNSLIVLAVVAIFGLFACNHSTKNVPAKVKTAFVEKFSDAKKIKWEKKNDTEWEAEFILNGKEMSANFDQNGQWLETETEIDEGQLPEAVKESLKNNFNNYEVEEAEYMESPEAKGFEIDLESDKEDIEVLIGQDGKILKQETEDEEE